MAEEKQAKFEDLLVDEEEINEDLLVNTVSTYTKIGSESGELVPQKAYQALTAKEKIAVVLLAQKARYELEMVDEEWLSPTEIANLSGIKSGTVFPAVRGLEEDNYAQNDDGSYRIPTVNIEKTKQFLEGDDE
ncbi:hypothetical protein NKF26_12010 [Haladaptatus sp. AB618]|uniref:hypothetical protein n=1 Tax=Haladaptatus sp. AB618 TaxID=2934173 RepID=UPI00209BED05|nr:hypothetical protein [Haladaptatus sp. AB618]MCO8254527.1 hypothetical protein [Haladaptatus sp. AB618]